MSQRGRFRTHYCPKHLWFHDAFSYCPYCGRKLEHRDPDKMPAAVPRQQISLEVLKTIYHLIEEQHNGPVHMCLVAQYFPRHHPGTIKRRIQELAQDGLLIRDRPGYYTIPNEWKDEGPGW